jgi:hypothetical protein
MVGNFSYNLIRIQYKISELDLKGLTRLIKWIGLKLIYIVLYPCFVTTQTQHMAFKTVNFLYNS